MCVCSCVCVCVCTLAPPPTPSEPDHERAISNLIFFEKEIQESPEKYQSIIVRRERVVHQQTLQYEQLCREAPPIVSHVTVCY